MDADAASTSNSSNTITDSFKAATTAGTDGAGRDGHDDEDDDDGCAVMVFSAASLALNNTRRRALDASRAGTATSTRCAAAVALAELQLTLCTDDGSALSHGNVSQLTRCCTPPSAGLTRVVQEKSIFYEDRRCRQPARPPSLTGAVAMSDNNILIISIVWKQCLTCTSNLNLKFFFFHGFIPELTRNTLKRPNIRNPYDSNISNDVNIQKQQQQLNELN